jgi:phage gpG-like protein
VGIHVEYAITHQKGATQGQYGVTSSGATFPWGDIPVRPFLPEDGLPDDWQEEVLDIIRRHLALV